MFNIKRFPKQAPIYHEHNDPTGIKRLHDRDFGEGSWDKLEQDVFKRHPEFGPGGMYHQKSQLIKLPIKYWWQFWKPESNIVSLRR